MGHAKLKLQHSLFFCVKRETASRRLPFHVYVMLNRSTVKIWAQGCGFLTCAFMGTSIVSQIGENLNQIEAEETTCWCLMIWEVVCSTL